MKTTGIVRRVDDLGRIVIPREYRRIYDINIGDPIEITADSEGVITLKRVDVISEFKRVSEGVASFLSEQFGWTVLVCDKRKYITGSGKRKGMFLDKEMSFRAVQLVENARSVIVSPNEFFPEQTDFVSAQIEPIMGERGVIGALFVLTERPLDESDGKIIGLSARLVTNNMQKY